MTLWHWAQLLLGSIALVSIARSARTLMIQAPCDAEALSDAITTAIEAGHRSLAHALADACRPAWVARAWSVQLEASTGGRRRAEELHNELVTSESDRLRTLSALGRLASPLAFLAIVLELANALHGEHGLVALQRGLVERIAIEHALLSFAIGAATTGVCVSAASVMRERLRALSRSLRRASPALELRTCGKSDM